MKQEVIQDFLNLPGIAGLALMDGRSRPYFHGIDQNLSFEQKAALAQGTLQVVETIPNGFDSFEFQFSGHQVHIYKLNQGMILLVLTLPNLSRPTYLKAIKDLKGTLQADGINAIATFRAIVGSITQSGLTYLQTPIAANLTIDATRSTTLWITSVTLQDLIAALNHLSQFTTQYLGVYVIANYWKSTCPNIDWLQQFQVGRSAQFSIAGITDLKQPLAQEEQQWIQDWVEAFMNRCAQVIRDFPTIVKQKALNERQKAILLG
jgi:hypothetical protein